MRILGIQIKEGCSLEVVKGLKPGWYPFVDCTMSKDNNTICWKKRNDFYGRLYQLQQDLPQITVSCIVGKNGSGKTTLLDIMYRIINNFSYNLVSDSELNSIDLSIAGGVNGLLFFECDNNIGYIENHSDGSVKLFYKTNADGLTSQISQVKYQETLHELFYTIAVNYSIHSMVFEDYTGKKEYKNKWLERLYKNEEEYFVPLSFTPERSNGQIDIFIERRKAERRLMTLAILLRSQSHNFLKDYKIERIEYSVNSNYEDNMNAILSSITVPKGLYGLVEYAVEGFKQSWKQHLNGLSISEDILEIIAKSLALEATHICFTYKSYSDYLKIADMHAAYERSEDILKAGNYDGVIHRIIKEQKESPILQDIHQILAYLLQDKMQTSGIINVEEFLNKFEKSSITYSMVYEKLPPVFFNCILYISKTGGKDTFKFEYLSSGEKQMLYSNSAILYHIYNIANAKADTRIIPYKHINIVLDEVELYAHPDFQRTYIHSFISLLSNMHINNSQLRSINLIIATHSPFILSDVPKENVLVLENGENRSIDGQTFCANIFDMLKSPFFLDSSIGEIAKSHLEKVIKAYNGDKELKHEFLSHRNFYLRLKDFIGDEYLKEEIGMMIDYIIEESQKS